MKSVRDLEALPLIWRESGSGTRAVVESVLKDSGVNPRKLDQRFELGSTEAIKSLVIAGLGVGFFSCWEIQQEIAMGLVRQINIPGLRIQRMFSWALPSGELGGLPGEFYQFADSIRSELSAVSVCKRVFEKLPLPLRSRAHLRDYGSHEHPMLRHRSQRRRLGLDRPYLPAARSGGRTRTTDLRAVLLDRI